MSADFLGLLPYGPPSLRQRQNLGGSLNLLLTSPTAELNRRARVGTLGPQGP